METERLIIRRFTPGDWRGLYKYLSQKEVVKYEPYDVFTRKEAKYEALRRSGDNSFWAVCLKENGKLIGNIYLSKKENNEWLLGYVFNRKFQGRGYATEAAKFLLNDIFKNENASKVTALCNPLNEKSWKLLERLGFKRTNHIVKDTYFKTDKKGNPIWVDTYEYTALADEW